MCGYVCVREEDEGVGCPFFFLSLSFSKGHGVTGAEENTIETQGVVNRVLFFFLLLAWMECRPFFFFSSSSFSLILLKENGSSRST